MSSISVLVKRDATENEVAAGWDVDGEVSLLVGIDMDIYDDVDDWTIIDAVEWDETKADDAPWIAAVNDSRWKITEAIGECDLFYDPSDQTFDASAWVEFRDCKADERAKVAFCHYFGANEFTCDAFNDAYMGEYFTKANFAHNYVVDTLGVADDGGMSSYVDWEAYFDAELRNDYDAQDGFFFRTNW